jgi:hypothetical protein
MAVEPPLNILARVSQSNASTVWQTAVVVTAAETFTRAVGMRHQSPVLWRGWQTAVVVTAKVACGREGAQYLEATRQ